MRRSPLYRRPLPSGVPRSPARPAQPEEPTIARIVADALIDYMSRADAIPTWVLAADGSVPAPAQSDCDALYGALGLSGAITATLSAAERQSLWSRATFLRRVGEILGHFEFVDALGRTVSGPGDPTCAPHALCRPTLTPSLPHSSRDGPTPLPMPLTPMARPLRGRVGCGGARPRP
ncbi:hypothetical protein TW95_gp1411 [Pandoravirus inopinatum]|uniref:Uncharacterized protein n=1 Tax=Pandoravirus inopinatum TaxID=1605721 RepID=A0A0B5J8A6_9VIRU|nr:hypothetical protein TW95_gp1411 [Pandoravirus inopinatum]AJF98145.1 hypothetical protein [Pandoravirus inopinatum]